MIAASPKIVFTTLPSLEMDNEMQCLRHERILGFMNVFLPYTDEFPEIYVVMLNVQSISYQDAFQ